MESAVSELGRIRRLLYLVVALVGGLVFVAAFPSPGPNWLVDVVGITGLVVFCAGLARFGWTVRDTEGRPSPSDQ